MEKWQEKILTKIFHKDFLKDKGTIGTAFKEVCKPVEGKGDRNNKCIYNAMIEDKEDEYCTFELELQIYSFQLDVFNSKLRLTFGQKTSDYSQYKRINPICKIEYYISEKQEIYEGEVLRKRDYEKYVGYEFEGEGLIEEKEVTDFIFNDNKYKRIINNLMNIAVTGTFKGKHIFKSVKADKTSIKNPFEI